MPRKALATAVAVTPAPTRRATHRKTSAVEAAPAALQTQEEDIARLAYALWEERGCPQGTDEENWFRAQELILTGVK